MNVNRSPKITISEILFNSEKFSKNSETKIKLGKVVIVVGPNNSGKSQLLRDIEHFGTNVKMKIVSSLDLQLPSEEKEIESIINKYKTEPQPDGLRSDVIHLSSPKIETNAEPLTTSFSFSAMKLYIKNKEYDKLEPILKFYRVRLDGKTRFDLVSNRRMGIKLKPGNFFASLNLDNDLRKKLRKNIFDEFGWYFYFENNDGEYALKTSREYKSYEVEKSDSVKDLQFLADAEPIDEQGHGFQSFVGLTLAISSLNHNILLIDEPEAYLHPPQALHLGQQLTELAEKRESTLIAATHSSDFLMGCMEQSDGVTIIRLSYHGPVGTVKKLSKDEVLEFIKNPLLRSTETLNALFHKSAIISEGDSDRIFYGAINRRLNYLKKEGIDDPIFLNGLGKDTLHRMVGALRKIGNPAVCIYDLDIMERGDSPKEYWIEYLLAMNIPKPKAEELEKERMLLESALKKKKKDGEPDPFRKLGLSSLEGVDKNRAELFLKELEKYGIFVVKVGGVEGWMKNLNVPSGNKKKWLIKVLEKLGYDKDPNAIQPTSDDVWEFIKKIRQWVLDPNRLGMPD